MTGSLDWIPHIACLNIDILCTVLPLLLASASIGINRHRSIRPCRMHECRYRWVYSFLSRGWVFIRSLVNQILAPAPNSNTLIIDGMVGPFPSLQTPQKKDVCRLSVYYLTQPPLAPLRALVLKQLKRRRWDMTTHPTHPHHHRQSSFPIVSCVQFHFDVHHSIH